MIFINIILSKLQNISTFSLTFLIFTILGKTDHFLAGASSFIGQPWCSVFTGMVLNLSSFQFLVNLFGILELLLLSLFHDSKSGECLFPHRIVIDGVGALVGVARYVLVVRFANGAEVVAVLSGTELTGSGWVLVQVEYVYCIGLSFSILITGRVSILFFISVLLAVTY